MSLAEERDLVPLGTGFDIVKRGYSRTQVEEHLERLDGDLRLLAADRDAAATQAADLARQLERSRSEIDELNSQIKRLAMPPTTLEGLSERLQRMLRMAQEEASETRARAEAEAGHIRARAESDATVLRERYERMLSDLDDRRAEMEAEHRDVLAKARAEVEERATSAAAEREGLDRAAEHRRAQADEDFEIAMTARRADVMKTLAEQEATSKAEAEGRVRDAAVEAARIAADIAERDEQSKNEAEHRVREATDDARQRTDAATARVEELRSLRTQLAEQLGSARELLAGCLPDLEPLPDETASTNGNSAHAEHGRHVKPSPAPR